jgi:hypothetical protein
MKNVEETQETSTKPNLNVKALPKKEDTGNKAIKSEEKREMLIKKDITMSQSKSNLKENSKQKLEDSTEKSTVP